MLLDLIIRAFVVRHQLSQPDSISRYLHSRIPVNSEKLSEQANNFRTLLCKVGHRNIAFESLAALAHLRF